MNGPGQENLGAGSMSEVQPPFQVAHSLYVNLCLQTDLGGK